MPRILTATLCVATLFIGAGCQKPAEPIHQTAALVSIEDAEQFDRLWDDTVEVLRRYDFIPDRQDRSAGVITTVPVTSAHWFEFWRQDITTGYAFAQSNLSSVRRSAKVNIDRSDEQDEYVLAVRINVERLSTPERQVNSPAGAYVMFGTRLPTTTGERLRGKSPDRWLPVGRDASLESTILARIIDRFHPASYEYVEYATDDDAALHAEQEGNDGKTSAPDEPASEPSTP